MTTLFAPGRVEEALQGARQQVEVIGTHLRAAGMLELRGFHRLSDFVSLQSGSLQLRDVTLLNRRGMPTADQFDELEMAMTDVTLIAQREPMVPEPASQDVYVEKVHRRILAITVGHLVEGTISLYPGADLRMFLQASDPPFLPLLDARVRWLTDRRLKTRFAFVLLNRSHIVASAAADSNW